MKNKRKFDYFISNVVRYFDFPNENQKDFIRQDGDCLIVEDRLTQKYRRNNEEGFTTIKVSYDFDSGLWKVNGSIDTTLDKAYIKYLNHLTEHLEKEIDIHEKRFRNNRETISKICDKNEKLTDDLKKFDILKVVYNKEKATTVVWFYNGVGEKPEKVIVHRQKGTKDDIYTAVAYAIAKRKYKNNSSFQKIVDSKLERH